MRRIAFRSAYPAEGIEVRESEGIIDVVRLVRKFPGRGRPPGPWRETETVSVWPDEVPILIAGLLAAADMSLVPPDEVAVAPLSDEEGEGAPS